MYQHLQATTACQALILLLVSILMFPTFLSHMACLDLTLFFEKSHNVNEHNQELLKKSI